MKIPPCMIEWANSEIGVIIHFDIEVFDPTWIHLKGNTLNPPQILHVLIPINWTPINGFRAAKSLEATYALLTAKHTFRLYSLSRSRVCIFD